MGCISFDGFHEIRYEIIPPLQVSVYGGACLFALIPIADQLVVYADAIYKQNDNDGDNNNEDSHNNASTNGVWTFSFMMPCSRAFGKSFISFWGFVVEANTFRTEIDGTGFLLPRDFP
jgi:hypothetical protein